MPIKKIKVIDYFMLEEFGRVETLNSILCRLRGIYVTQAVYEERLPSPNQEKIKKSLDRAKEITEVLRKVFWKSPGEQESAINKFGSELKKLKRAFDS